MRDRRDVCIIVKSKFTIILFLLSLGLVVSENCLGQIVATPPPYDGSIFIDPDVITSNDPRRFQHIRYIGRQNKTVYDFRTSSFNVINAYIVEVTYSDGNPFRPVTTTCVINPEFGSVRKAKRQARKYGRYLSQLPLIFRQDIDELWIHKGTNTIAAGTHPVNHILIHTGDAQTLIRDEIFEETLLHEAAHVSLDPIHSNSAAWLAAQNADGQYLTLYAAQNPTTEDLAESFGAWFAVRKRANRLSVADRNTITNRIPHRLTFFDNLSLNTSPQNNTATPSAKLATSNNAITNGASVEPSVGNSNETATLSTNSKELLNTKQFEIYPIPATDVLNIKLENTNKEQTTISIYNLMGTVVFSKKYSSKDLKTQIDLSTFERGIYSLVIEQKGELSTQNFIIK